MKVTSPYTLSKIKKRNTVEELIRSVYPWLDINGTSTDTQFMLNLPVGDYVASAAYQYNTKVTGLNIYLDSEDKWSEEN
ncbi:hypothetical protein ACHQM5_011465 [Ranunculus cassubicifolius]